MVLQQSSMRRSARLVMCALFIRHCVGVQQSSCLSFVVQPVTGKGLGCIAARDINVGEHIISESPALVVPQRVSWLKVSDLLSAEKLESQIEKLTAAQKNEFWALSGHGGSSALHVFLTNAYSLGVDGGGVFPLISRINSACIPNVHAAWDSQRRVLSVHAVQPVPQGAELLNSYTSLYDPFEVRQQYLQQHFGFTCSCPACSLGKTEREESDERRQRLQNVLKGVDEDEIRDVLTESDALLRAEGLFFPSTRLQFFLACLPPPPSAPSGMSWPSSSSHRGLSCPELAQALECAVQSKGQASPEAERLRRLSVKQCG